MTGDLFDLKKALVAIFTDPSFLVTVAAVVADKGDGISPSFPADVPTVLPYERLTKQVPLPLLEFIAYQTQYTQDTAVKEGRHRLGARWSVIEATEELATRSVEVLMTATTITLFGDNTSRGSLLADAAAVNSGPVSVLEEDYAPLLPQPGTSAFVKSAVVVFELTTWRD